MTDIHIVDDANGIGHITDNGIVHVGGFGDMKVSTAKALEQQARARLRLHRVERDTNAKEIAALEELIAERRARLRFLDGFIASDEKALGETPAPKTKRTKATTDG